LLSFCHGNSLLYGKVLLGEIVNLDRDAGWTDEPVCLNCRGAKIKGIRSNQSRAVRAWWFIWFDGEGKRLLVRAIMENDRKPDGLGTGRRGQKAEPYTFRSEFRTSVGVRPGEKPVGLL
jgi:hypothetical protein